MSENPSAKQGLFYFSILLPGDLSTRVKAFQLDFARRFQSERALRQWPHITVIPPFKMALSRFQQLEDRVQEVQVKSDKFTIDLKDFGAFPKRVIFIEPVFQPQLFVLNERLNEKIEDIIDSQRDYREYHPHVTLAYRDLSEDHFEAAWKEYSRMKFEASFSVSSVFLMKMEEGRWKVEKEYPFLLNQRQ